MPKVGRPSKYDPSFCGQLVTHMRTGLSFESFAGTVGVNRDTLYTWTRKHAAFADAKKKGTAACLLWWERVGIAAVTGRDLTDAQGKVVIEAKKIHVVMWIYNMKCRFREQWHDDGAPPKDDDRRALQLAYARKAKPHGTEKKA